MSPYENINIFGPQLPQSIGSGDPSYLLETLGNVPSSAYQLGSDVAQVVTSPVQTLDAIGNLGLGLIALAIPDAYQEERLDKPQEAAMAVGKYISDRYGGLDKAKESLKTDPVGVLADVSGILLGGGYLATKSGLKVGELATKAGIATDPLVIAGKGASTAISKAIPTTSGLPSLGRMNELIQEGKVSVGDQYKTDMLTAPTNIDKNKIVDVRRNLGTKVNDPDLKDFKVQTIHDVKVKKDGTVSNAESGIGDGKALGYDPAVSVRSNGVGIELKVNQKARDQIASKQKPKFPMAAVRGIYDDVDIFDPDLRLGFNPMRQNIFTDEQGYAVKSIKDGKATIVDNDVMVKLNNPEKFKIVKGVDGEDVKVFDDLEYYTKDNLPKTENPSVAKVLPEQAKGVTRRDVLKGAGAGLASLAVPTMSMMTDVTKAIPPVAKSTGVLAGIGKFKGIIDNISPYLSGSEKRRNILERAYERDGQGIRKRYDIDPIRNNEAIRTVFDRNYPVIGHDSSFGLRVRTPKVINQMDQFGKKYNLKDSDFSIVNTEQSLRDVYGEITSQLDGGTFYTRGDYPEQQIIITPRREGRDNLNVGDEFKPVLDSSDELLDIARKLDNVPDKKVTIGKVDTKDPKQMVYRHGTDNMEHRLTTGTVDGVPVMKVEYYSEFTKGEMTKINEELYIPNESGLGKLSKGKQKKAKGGLVESIDIFQKNS